MSPRKAQLSSPTKVRILEEYKIHGKKHHHISNLLNERGYNISPYQVRYFIHRYEKTGNIDRAPGSARPSKINNPAILSIIQAEMEKSDETSAEDVHAAVCREMGDDNYPLSVRSCSRARKKLLQYDCKEKKYGALVRVKNVPLRLEFAKEMLDKMQNGYTFEDRVFVDECTCKVDAGAGKGFVRRGQKTKKNRRPKHPSSVHVWAGISKRGKTFIVIFTGIMCKEEYAEILKMGLLPFTANAYPDGDWALWQDNDPKHSSRYMQKVYEENGITWYKTPAESPDLNPIELIWARLKAWLKYSGPTPGGGDTGITMKTKQSKLTFTFKTDHSVSRSGFVLLVSPPDQTRDLPFNSTKMYDLYQSDPGQFRDIYGHHFMQSTNKTSAITENVTISARKTEIQEGQRHEVKGEPKNGG